ncbi:MAG: CCA tRNA nucleotidyltransferase [Dehalococcoidales bacterium]|nr:CCA tRNA nucleotidyltransferase [Dehalococcoidales bacterium]
MQFPTSTKSKSERMDIGEKAPGDLFGSLVEPGLAALLNRVRDFLSGQGPRAYLVGGLIRDVLLSRETGDIDIALEGDALEVASRVATAFGGKYVRLDEENRVGRVILTGEAGGPAGKQWEIDFSSLVGGNIEADLARRDFTIDAVALELGRWTEAPLIDPFGGLSDLRQGTIRVVAPSAFTTDAARLLRGVRLAYQLGFAIESETEALIERHCHLLASVAGERLREELVRLLALPGSGKVLSHLDGLGLLTALIPELALARGVSQPKEHFWDVLSHSLNAVAAAGFVLGEGGWPYANDKVRAAIPWNARLEEHFSRPVSSGSTRRILLKLAALLHDVAKPQAKTIEADGRMRFLGHAQAGADITVAILERLRFSSREIKLTEALVRYHLRPTQMSQSGPPSARAIYRYFRDTGDAGIDILFLSLADHLATRGPRLEPDNWREHTQLVDYVLTKRFQEEKLVRPPRLVSGHDLISLFGLRPGPRIGELLEAVREAQASGEISNRDEALAYFGQCLSLKKKGGHGQKK